MVPLLHLGGGHGQDSPCTSSIRLTGAVCVTQLLKSDLPLSEGYGPSIERARPNPAVRGIGSAQDSVGLLTRNGDIRRNGYLMLGEFDFWLHGKAQFGRALAKRSFVHEWDEG